MDSIKVIHWFRQDLRLKDNPSLVAAAKAGIVLPLYIFDVENNQAKPQGAASQCWLYHALIDLNQQLGGKLVLLRGNPEKILVRLVKAHQVEEVHWNRCYEPWQLRRDSAVTKRLVALGVSVKSHNGFLLWEPWEIEKKDKEHYRVFTPFYRKGCLNAMPPRKPLPSPKNIAVTSEYISSDSLDLLGLLPKHRWHLGVMAHWPISEKDAAKQFSHFLAQGLEEYDEGRNFPAKQAVSRLSPYLHWGQVSPNQLWHTVKKLPQNKNTASFLSELGWREFSYHLLYHHPTLPHKNLQQKFDNFPWRKSKKLLCAWQKGLTGYPLVDAGMRELWQTGYMHNRVRMIVASFLVKNLLIHWREGEAWFWDCLVDADLASNSASWQWVAGCGADAAPFFRIFNPVTQAQKFDPRGEYIRHYVPELSDLPDKFIAAPWTAPIEVLIAAGVKLGMTYPKPIVALAQSREAALAAYKALSK